jgi:hypothetical protein
VVQKTDLATTKSVTGHSDANLVAYYSHATDESRKSLMSKLYADKNDGLKEIFERVKAGEMSFEIFAAKVKISD